MCSKSVMASVMFLAMVLPLPVLAEEEVTRLREEAQVLERRLEQQQAELTRLRAEQQRLLEKLSRLSAGAGATPAAETKAILSAGETAPPRPESSAAGKTDRLHIAGYGSFRFETNNTSGNNFIPGGPASSFTFRRFVLTTDARLNDRLRVYSETEFERLLELELEKQATAGAGGVKFAQSLEGNNGAEIGIEQLWLEFDLGRRQVLRAGIILPPLGRFNILHDDDYWDIPRRTLVDRDAPVLPVKVAWRELGAGLVGSLGLGSATRLDYQFYVTNGATLDFNLENVAQTRTPSRVKQALESEIGLASGAVDGSKTAQAVAWRVALSPTLAGEIALSGYHGRYTPKFLRRSEPIHAFGVDGKWRFRRFEVEGEAIYSTFGDTRRVVEALASSIFNSSAETSRQETAALESEVEVELGGLARRRYGFWTDVKYHWRPSFLKKSFLRRGFEDPQLIPIVRYDRVWLRENIEELEFAGGVVTGLETANLQQDRVTLGLNYRPTQQVGLQVAYERNQRRGGERLIFPRLPLRSTHGLLLGMTFAF